MMAGITRLTAHVRYSTCTRARERDRETASWGTLKGRGHAGESESVFVLDWRNETMTPTHFRFIVTVMT